LFLIEFEIELANRFLFAKLLALLSKASNLVAEAVEGAALPLEGVDNVKSSDGLAAGMLSVGDGVTDDVLKEDLEDTTGLLVDQARDTLDTTTASQTADGGLSDTLDVVAKDLPVPLCTALAETLATLTTTRHLV